MQYIKSLFDLQELDQKLSAREISLAEVRTNLADDSAIVLAKERVGSLGARLEELETKRRGAERTTSDLQERMTRLESRLYSGAVTSAKELSAAQEEREFTLRQQSEAEDVLLELMVEAEEVESAHAKALETLQRLEVERPIEVAELREREADISAEIDALRKHRDEITPSISTRLLLLYDSLRKSKNGYAVAKVERGMCQGCRLTLSTMELQRARGASNTVQCSSCRRILFVE